MKVRKAIKKIAALAAGASMVGATILGAMAADLDAYPAPFVKDGIFDAVIVVGADAATADVVGAVDIGASLQFEMRQEEAVSLGSGDVSITEGVKIEKTGNAFNYNESIADLDNKLDESDLPVILAEGTYKDSEGATDNEETYEQELTFVDETGTCLYIPDDSDDNEPLADYLVFYSGMSAYTYTLNFDSAIEWDVTADDGMSEDFEGTMLEIQGNDYTVTDVDFTINSSNTAETWVEEITLMAGDTVIWMQQGKTLTRMIGGAEHEIEVVDVNDQENMCGISVDGDVVWIDKGDTAEINGVEIGVTDAVAVHAQLQDTDICKVNLGASEIVLTHDDEINDIDGSKALFGPYEVSGTFNELDTITISYDPDEDVFIPADGSWSDPILGNFEFGFGGVSKETEEINVDISGDDGSLKFNNNDGDEVEIDFIYDDDNDKVYFGHKLKYTVGTGANAMLFNGSVCDGALMVTGGDVSQCNGIRALAISDGCEARVIEISGISNSNQEVDIKDLTTGKSHNDVKVDEVIDVLGFVIDLSVNGTQLAAVDLLEDTGCNNLMATELSGAVAVDPSTAPGNVTMMFGEDFSYTNFAVDGDTITVRVEAVGDEMQVKRPVGVPNFYSMDEDSDVKSGATTWGTIVTYDSEDNDDLTIEYPEEEVECNVFISPVGAEIIGSAGGDLTAITIDKINVGAAKLDTEIAGQEKSQNIIVVGGPCINGAARALMGVTKDNCLEGAEPGKAVIKLYENGGNVAMLVSGYSADDTRRATRVVANYDSSAWASKFTGNEIVVTGTSLTDITVSAPQ